MYARMERYYEEKSFSNKNTYKVTTQCETKEEKVLSTQ